MEFTISENSTTAEFQSIRDEINRLIDTYGLCEVRLEQNPVLNVNRGIVVHGEYELLLMLLDPLLSKTELVFSPDHEEGDFDPDCGTAIIYPLYQEKARDRAL